MKQKLWDVIFSALMKHSSMLADIIPIGSKLLPVRAVTDVHGFAVFSSHCPVNINYSEWRCAHVEEELFDGLISPVQMKKNSSRNESLEVTSPSNSAWGSTHSICVLSPQSHSDIPIPVFIHLPPISSFSSSSLSASVFPSPQIIG